MEISIVGLGECMTILLWYRWYWKKKTGAVDFPVVHNTNWCNQNNFSSVLFYFEVNSTGFLVQNYENLGDTNIDTFFVAFKNQIKSTQIKSENVINFVRGLYHF